MRGWVVVIIAIVCLIVGGIGGAVLGSGAGAGFGIVAGLLSGSQAGVCLTIETAKEQGMLAQDKANALVSTTIGKIKSVLPANVVQGIPWMANEQDCANKVAELKQKVAASK
jgi:hypothetical protein